MFFGIDMHSFCKYWSQIRRKLGPNLTTEPEVDDPWFKRKVQHGVEVSLVVYCLLCGDLFSHFSCAKELVEEP